MYGLKTFREARAIRHVFLRALFAGVRVVWPVLSALISIIMILGLVVGTIERWSVAESIYFAFITGLTIGYGDLTPHTFLTRSLSVAIGICGLLITALIAAVAVQGLSAVLNVHEERKRAE